MGLMATEPQTEFIPRRAPNIGSSSAFEANAKPEPSENFVFSDDAAPAKLDDFSEAKDIHAAYFQVEQTEPICETDQSELWQ